MTMEEMLAEILTRLEEQNAQLHSLVEPSTSVSPASTLILTADTEEREASASTISTKPATTSSASLLPTATPAPSQDADPGFQSGVTDISDIHHALPDPVSTDGELCILFDADADADAEGRGVDRLSRLSDPLLRDIVSRLPIKDAARTAVLSRRWSSIQRATLLLVDPVDLAVFHLNSNRICGLVPRSLDRLHMLRELDLSNNRLVGTADQEQVVCWSSVSTNRKTATTFPASPMPCSRSATPWRAGPAILFTFPENAVATHARCSTLGLYHAVITLMPATTSSGSPISTSTVRHSPVPITKHLLATSPTSMNHRQGNMIPKPPWLLGTDVSRSWSGGMQLISGYLLEILPWCSDYTLWVQWQQPMTPNHHVLTLLSGVLWEFEPWPPPYDILCWMICRILDQCGWNYCQLSLTSSTGVSSPAMETNVASINWLGGKQASRVDSSQVAAHAYHPSHSFDATGTAMDSAPSCRPWEHGELLRRPAAFKLSTWASKPKVASSLACAQRGWVNVDLDKIECESGGEHLIFNALTSWSPVEVANAGESFAEQFDVAHQNSCPWRGNDCDDSLFQFHLTQSALIGGFKDRCNGLLQFTSLLMIASSAIANMKLTRSTQIDCSLPQSITLLSGILGCRAESTAGIDIDIHQDLSYSCSQAQKLISLDGWEPRWLPNGHDCQGNSMHSAKNAPSVGPDELFYPHFVDHNKNSFPASAKKDKGRGKLLDSSTDTLHGLCELLLKVASSLSEKEKVHYPRKKELISMLELDKCMTEYLEGQLPCTLLKIPWPPPNSKMMLLLLCFNCLLSQPASKLERCFQWKCSECEKLWGTDELSIPMGDMSYLASEISGTEITGLNPHEVVTVDKDSSSKFGLSKPALLLLFGKHSEITSCQISVDRILQWSPPNQNKFVSMLVELEKLPEHLVEMLMKARAELFAYSIGMNSCWVLLMRDRVIMAWGQNLYQSQVWPAPYALGSTINLKLLAKCNQCKVQLREPTILLNSFLRLRPWDPGGLLHKCEHGLGTSRVSRREVCQEPPQGGPSNTRMGWSTGLVSAQGSIDQTSPCYKTENECSEKVVEGPEPRTGGGERELEASLRTRVTLPSSSSSSSQLPVHVPRTI